MKSENKSVVIGVLLIVILVGGAFGVYAIFGFGESEKDTTVIVAFAIVAPPSSDLLTSKTYCWVDGDAGDMGSMFDVSPNVKHVYTVECIGFNGTVVRSFGGDFTVPQVAKGWWFIILLDWETTAGRLTVMEMPHYEN
jgi:hypothetical protein